MRRVTGGNGEDTTLEVMLWLQRNRQLFLANLYLIGEADDPAALYLTDYESPLCWPCWGTFQSTVIKRGGINSQVGLSAESLELTWSPRNQVITNSLDTTSPYAQARLGWFDNKRVRVWRCVMPTPGDANTFGAYPIFGGFIGDIEPQRGAIKFTVNSYLYTINQKVPSGVIEVTNTMASYIGGTPPAGYSSLPQFNVLTGSNDTAILADMISPTAHSVPGVGRLKNGYMVFNKGSGATLGGHYSLIGNNSIFTDVSNHHLAQFQLLSPLPWPPTPGVDTFYVSAASPVDQADGDYYGFPYVPAPETAA